LTPIAAPPAKKAKSTGTTSSTVATSLPRPDSVSHVIAFFAAGGSLDLTLPPIGCRPGIAYILKVSLGGDVESLRLQVAVA
jgi:hypothetical protein